MIELSLEQENYLEMENLSTTILEEFNIQEFSSLPSSHLFDSKQYLHSEGNNKD